MAATHPKTARFLALAVMAGLAVSACDPVPPPSPTALPRATATAQPTVAPSSTAAPQSGGTIYLLKQSERFDQVDPQRIYAGEDLAFFGATVFRSLEAYVVDPDPATGTVLQPDLATDLGTPTDGARTWTFTLRDGVTFEDGSPITCEDVAYGVSRTFATDVINQGPTYAIADLDIPFVSEGSSAYPGPYQAKPAQQAMFDKAVQCSADHRTITFHLNRPIGDFNYATSLGMSPVPRSADTGETYGLGKPPVSSGPYRIKSYKTGKNGEMLLVRNPNWSAASDPIRLAYPDSWEVDLGLDPTVIDQRLIAASGKDAFALQVDHVQPDAITTIFGDGLAPRAQFAGRAISDFDPYVRYFWINVQKVPNLKIRQAVMVALDREAIREIRGGPSWGTFADGVLKPTIGLDYAPTGIWDSYFGKPIPTTGDPDLARQLIAESGETVPTLKLERPYDDLNSHVADLVTASLTKAGIAVTQVPYGCRPGTYCSVVAYEHMGDMGSTGWGADWPNASTVMPFLFTQQGGWDLSNVDDPAVNAAIQAAESTTDRATQAQQWQALNRQAVENAWVIPTFFGLSQSFAGTKAGPIYRWPAYASWPYPVMYVKP